MSVIMKRSAEHPQQATLVGMWKRKRLASTETESNLKNSVYLLGRMPVNLMIMTLMTVVLRGRHRHLCHSLSLNPVVAVGPLVAVPLK